MAASTAPAAKAALVSILQAAIPGVPVTWAGPSVEATLERDAIWLGEVDQSEEWRGLGAAKRTEDYTVTLFCQTVRQGNDPQATEEACWSLRASVQTAVRANKELNGTLGEAGYAELRRTVTNLQTVEGGWSCRASVQVHCTAII